MVGPSGGFKTYIGFNTTMSDWQSDAHNHHTYKCKNRQAIINTCMHTNACLKKTTAHTHTNTQLGMIHLSLDGWYYYYSNSDLYIQSDLLIISNSTPNRFLFYHTFLCRTNGTQVYAHIHA